MLRKIFNRFLGKLRKKSKRDQNHQETFDASPQASETNYARIPTISNYSESEATVIPFRRLESSSENNESENLSETETELKISASLHATFFSDPHLKLEEIEDLLFLHQSEYLYFIQVLLIQPDLITEFLNNEIHHDKMKGLDIPAGYLFVQEFIEALIRPEYEEKNEKYLSVVSAYAKIFNENNEDNSDTNIAQQALLDFFEKNPAFKNTLLANRRLLSQTAFLYVHMTALKLRRSNSDDNENNNNNNNNSFQRG